MSLAKQNHNLFLVLVALVGWLVPGGGYFLIKEKKRAAIVFFTIVITFCLGIYVGSIGVIDFVGNKPWFAAQVSTSPLVAILARVTASGYYTVYGRPGEIGQIYTSLAGLLNLLCIINSVYLVHLNLVEKGGERNVS